ncbi:hypothetical protein B0J14DRAFT_679150 [Halenospora varia]|nr:hypothetical protein B0J14DRAFT_679150 [Halenospora varia]
MAETLAIVSGVAGLLSLTITILDASLAYYSSAKDASTSMSNLLKELICMKAVLSSIQDSLVTNPKICSAYEAAPSSSKVSHLALDLVEFKILNKIRRGLEKEVQKEMEELHRYRELFATSLTVDILTLGASTRKEVKSMRKEQQEWQTKSSELKILEWLSSMTFDDKHADVEAKRQLGTAQWVLDSDAFAKWMEGASSNTIWCPGDPGVGKTITTSLVIDHLLSRQTAGDIGVAYIYCDYHNEINTTPIALLGSLTRQLIQNQHTGLPNELKMQYARSRDGLSTLTISEHIKLLRIVAARNSRSYIVIDALDELENRQNGTRRAMIGALQEIAADSVYVFVTSRPHLEDINLAFQFAERLDIVATRGDIERFLRAKISENSDLQELLEDDWELEERIIECVLGKAKQQFLLPALHIDRLADCTCVEEIRESLEDMATTLRETYDQAIERIRQQPNNRSALAFNVLKLISHCKRPLRVAELREALAIKPKIAKITPGSLRTSKKLLDVCIGLVSIEEKTDVIRLVHYTVYEYLQHSDLFKSAEFDIAQLCLTYLEFEALGVGPCVDPKAYQARLHANPFFEYAAKYLGHHAYAYAPSDFDNRLAQRVLQFFRHSENLSSAIQAQFITPRRTLPYDIKPFSEADGLWFAARFGLVNVIKLLLADGVKANTRNFDGVTALHEASSRGHTEVVRLLLLHGADINIPRGFVKHTHGPLPARVSACLIEERFVHRPEHIPFIRHMSTQPYQSRPSACAQAQNHPRVNSLALEADQEARLLKAAKKGDEDKALHNLVDGGNAKAQDNNGRTILQWAALNNLERLAKEALKYGCPVDTIDNCERAGTTPLLEVSRHPNGSVKILKLLLQWGADPNSRGSQWFGFRSPLHECALRGDREKTALLLEYGANSKMKDYIGQEPVDLALRMRDQALVTLLQEQDSQSTYQETALHIAASNGSKDIVRLLLSKGANIAATTINNEIPLHWAASAGHSNTLQLLLEAHQNFVGDLPGLEIPLHLAALRGHQTVVKILLARGVNINAISFSRRTALHAAAK